MSKAKTITKDLAAMPAPRRRIRPSLQQGKQVNQQAGKNFDAVKTMRDIRDQISKEIMNMTFAEEKAYLKKLLSKKAVKTS